MVRVKICGITSVADAQAAVTAGADALGFMFYRPSSRFVSSGQAAEIIRSLPPFVVRVGVFVDATEREVGETIEQTGINALQFHGSEGPEYIRRFRAPVVKAFRLRDRASLERFTEYEGIPWLVDSFVPGQLGGTGAVCDWQLAAEAARRASCLILAGGLTPSNVARAVEQVRPYGVDVSSGVEAAPGIKDPARMKAFVQAARCISAV
jgi:phosphoribosylanthranilate isomerase